MEYFEILVWARQTRHSEPAAPSPCVHLSECFLPSPSFDAKAKDEPIEPMYGAKLRHSRCEFRSQFLIELPNGFVAGGMICAFIVALFRIEGTGYPFSELRRRREHRAYLRTDGDSQCYVVAKILWIQLSVRLRCKASRQVNKYISLCRRRQPHHRLSRTMG